MYNYGVCSVPRFQYLVRTNETKLNNQPLTANDYMDVGFMAGRFGIDLRNPNIPHNIMPTPNGVVFDINSCTADLFEQNLNRSGIRFDRIA